MKSWTVIEKSANGALKCRHVSAPMGASAAYEFIKETFGVDGSQILALIPGAQEVYDTNELTRPLPVQK
jgi:hypothetical protein